MAREFVERDQIHGIAVEYEFNACVFDQWRRRVNDLLYSLGGCDDIYYQRFSKDVVQPRVKDLEQGLRILSAVRDDVARVVHTQERSSSRRGWCRQVERELPLAERGSTDSLGCPPW